ncbi:MAG: sporulation protein YtxC [Bacillota bacterium]|jgi:putative sporulation protein YtxC
MTSIKISVKDDALRKLLLLDLRSIPAIYCHCIDNTIFCFYDKKRFFSSKDMTLKKCLADTLAAFIFNQRELWYLKRLLNKRYNCFSEEELIDLEKNACYLLNNESFNWGYFAGRDRQKRLSEAFLEHLTEYDDLDLDGFISFRLVGYEEYLLAVLTLAADDLLGEQEDSDYIIILRDFLANQKSCCTELHLFLIGNCYHLLKEQGGELYPLEGGRLHDREEILISCMILLAPLKLIVHTKNDYEQPNFIKSLQDIFYNRLWLCYGCSLCQDQK